MIVNITHKGKTEHILVSDEYFLTLMSHCIENNLKFNVKKTLEVLGK